MSPEVLIYINKLRDFLSKNQESKEYFLHGINEEIFFEHLTEFSEKNFKENGEPTLTIEQFELIRKMLQSNDKKEYITYPNMFWDFDGYGKICLN